MVKKNIDAGDGVKTVTKSKNYNFVSNYFSLYANVALDKTVLNAITFGNYTRKWVSVKSYATWQHGRFTERRH